MKVFGFIAVLCATFIVPPAALCKPVTKFVIENGCVAHGATRIIRALAYVPVPASRYFT